MVSLLRLTGTFDAVASGLRLPLLIIFLLAAAGVLSGTLHLAFPARLGLPQGRAAELDERQAARVAQANTVAYRALALTVLLGAESVGLFGVDLTALRGHQDTVQDLMLLILPFLLTAILAWTEPTADGRALPTRGINWPSGAAGKAPHAGRDRTDPRADFTGRCASSGLAGAGRAAGSGGAGRGDGPARSCGPCLMVTASRLAWSGRVRPGSPSDQL